MQYGFVALRTFWLCPSDGTSMLVDISRTGKVSLHHVALPNQEFLGVIHSLRAESSPEQTGELKFIDAEILPNILVISFHY